MGYSRENEEALEVDGKTLKQQQCLRKSVAWTFVKMHVQYMYIHVSYTCFVSTPGGFLFVSSFVLMIGLIQTV